MYGEELAAEAAQSFAYEIKKDSAVIWRCFSRDTRAEIPAQIDGHPVTEIAPYAFSAHFDEKELQKRQAAGLIRLYVPGSFPGETAEETAEKRAQPGGHSVLAEACAQPCENDTSFYRKLPPLCGEGLEEIVLPETVRRVGRYCFYDCGNLRRIEFWGTLTDWGSGVFTRCHRVSELRVHTDGDGRSYLKDVLDELPETLRVEYFAPQTEDKEHGASWEEAHLVFPEFYEEGVENTPARILETHVHGSGISYRNCFQGRRFDFVQYDRLFPQAKALESSEVVAWMVTGRLRHPAGLTEEARSRYEAYVFEHAKELAAWLLETRDMDGVRWLTELPAADREALLAYMTEYASKLHFAEAVSYLMDCRRGGRRAKRRRLEL